MATKKAAVKAARSAVQSEQEQPDESICFTIMPYGRWPDLYYDVIYRPAIEASGLIPKRADELSRPSAITHDIWVLANQAKVMLADLSGENPNVFYELGLGHALGKPAILITDSSEQVPFDLRSLRVIVYDKNKPDWGERLKKKIQIAIEEVMSSPADAVLLPFLIRELQRKKHLPQGRKQAGAPARSDPDNGRGPRMTLDDAVEFTQRSLETKAPRAFIMSALAYYGFEKETAQRILERAQAESDAPKSGDGEQQKK